MDKVATTAVFFLFFRWVFYFVTTVWISEIGLCENSINQSTPGPAIGIGTTDRRIRPRRSGSSRYRQECHVVGTRLAGPL